MKSDRLKNLATKDQATEEITDFLLNVQKTGQCQLQTFVEERLLPDEDRSGKAPKKFSDTMKRNKTATFGKLYDMKITGTQSVSLRADRSVFQRLIISYEAG